MHHIQNKAYDCSGNRIMRLCVVVALVLQACVFPQPVQGENTSGLVSAVTGVGITVSDLDDSIVFYTEVLGFEKISEVERHGQAYEQLLGLFGVRIKVATLKLGEEQIELIEFMTPLGRPIPRAISANDLSFQHIAIIVSDMEKAYEHLRNHDIQHASTGPQTLPDWNKGAAGIKAFYFRDPDGHFLEVLWFPPDKGEPKWHKKTDRLFLGIDHTAIVVADTELSLRVYRDQLGMEVVGSGVNYGTEQEHLNNVFGARLRITTLRAEEGPAVEFLEYLTPRDGRSAPSDTKVNDLWHWHIKLRTGSEQALRGILNRGVPQIVSSDVTTMPDKDLGFEHGLLTRDPDGHALLFQN